MSIRTSRIAEHGVAAVEFAILLPFLIILLTAPLYIGRVLWQYTAVHKAAHDAAQYLSSVPDVEMRSTNLVPPATVVAKQIIADELADLNPGDYPPVVTILCDAMTCDGYTAPNLVSVGIRMRVQDPLFNNAFGDDGILISANVHRLYIGSQ